nr:protein YgfX [Snodgrassella alvi]
MREFMVRVRPSLLLQLLAVMVHVITFAAILMYVPDTDRWYWLAGLIVCALWSFYGLHQPVIRRIEIDDQLQAKLILAKGTKMIVAELRADSMVRRNLLALNWHTNNGVVRTLLLPDMTDKQSWRRLQIWARWCQPQKKPVNTRQRLYSRIVRRQR